MNFQISPQKMVLVFISTSSISEFPFSYTFSKYCIISMFSIFAKAKALYFVSVCSALIISEAKLLFVCLLATCISLNYLFRYQINFPNDLFLLFFFFAHLFNKYLLNTYYVLGPMLGSGMSW